jgi:hypothetical protein
VRRWLTFLLFLYNFHGCSSAATILLILLLLEGKFEKILQKDIPVLKLMLVEPWA